MIEGNIILMNLCSFKLSEGLKKHLRHSDFERTQIKSLALDPQYTYVHPSSLYF